MSKTEKTPIFSIASYIRYLAAIPLTLKIYLCFIPVLCLYMFSEMSFSLRTTALLSSLFLFGVFCVTLQDYRRFLTREKLLAREAELLDQVEKSLKTFKENMSIVEAQEKAKQEALEAEKEEKNEFKIPIPDCAVILGPKNTESYVIPYNLYSLATHEVTALKAASNVLKKKGLTFQILNYKQNHPFFDNPQTKTGVEHIKALQQFPPNFLNYN